MATRPKRFHPPGYTPRPKAERNREADRRRGSAADRGYDGAWAKASRGYRRSHPWCEYCEAGAFGEVRFVSSSLTDHLYPHRGDQALFWTRELWVACCADCHNGPKQRLENAGVAGLDRLARLLGRPTLASLPARPAGRPPGGASKV